MAKGDGGVPWPVWAAVMILVALIGLYGAYISRQSGSGSAVPSPKSAPQTPEPSPLDVKDISNVYYIDGNPARVVEVERQQGNHYRIEERTGPWPWVGSADLNGDRLFGPAEFVKSSARMNLHGVVLANGSIQIEYQFITKGDGSPARGRSDHHIWVPR